MIRSLLFRNLGLKILSLCFALVLWYSVVSERQSNLLVTVPLTFVNVPKTMKVRMVSDERVSLHLEGPISSLRAMEIGKLRGTIDLAGAHEGKSRFELLPSHFNLPEGIKVAGISPEVVYIVLERLKTFKLPVKPRLKGKIDPHYAIQKVYVIPKHVWVTGDRKARSSIDNIPTEVIDIDGLKQGLEKEASLEVPRDVRLKENIEHVKVHVELRKKVWDKKVDGVKVNLKRPVGAYSCVVEPGLIKVYVRGWATVIDNLSASDVGASVSTKGLAPGVHYLAPKVVVPQGVKVLSTSPEKIKVVVSVRTRK